jgi:Holliday junction DNA helicase RuvB
LIGATTRSGLLASPLRDRFGIFHHLDFYSSEDLAKIVSNSAKKLNVDLDPAASFEIARRARGTPRIANRLLRRVRDFAQVKTMQGKIDKALVEQAMKTLRIDDIGLDEIDRRLLRVIEEQYKGGPVGIDALAATLNEEVDTIVDVVEPYLLKIGFLKRTSRGRELGAPAVKYVNASFPKERLQKELF